MKNVKNWGGQMSDEEKIKVIKQRLSDTKVSQRYTNAPKISINYIWKHYQTYTIKKKKRMKN